MSRPSLFRWMSRWAVGSFVCLVLVAAGLIVVNAIDYAPYGLALRRAQNLTAHELEALGSACTRLEQRGHQRLFGADIPADFRSLKPVRVSIYPGCTDISLIEKGDDRYIFIRVSTSAENQEIELVTDPGTKQVSRRLWDKHPELTRRLNPVGRIVTIAVWGTRESREWIVLPDRLLVVDRSWTTGGSDRIVGAHQLSPNDCAAIHRTIAKLPDEIRGRAFDAGAMDGLHLRVSLSPDGAPNTSTDIVLANTWRGELTELVAVISKLAGSDLAIEFPGDIESMNSEVGQHQPSRFTLAEYEERMWGSRLPWWCWWPRIGALTVGKP